MFFSLQRLFFLSIFLCVIGCSREKHPDFTLFTKAINKEKLVIEDGIFYRNRSSDPYSGAVFTLYPTGALEMEAILKEGKPDGRVIHWYESGQCKKEAYYVNGKLDGLTTVWYPSGQKKQLVTYEDNQMNGVSISWYENGEKQSEKYYQNNRVQSSLQFSNEKEN